MHIFHPEKSEVYLFVFIKIELKHLNWGGGESTKNLMKNIFLNTIDRELSGDTHVKLKAVWGKFKKKKHALEHSLIHTFLIRDVKFLSNKVSCTPLLSKRAKSTWDFKIMIM